MRETLEAMVARLNASGYIPTLQEMPVMAKKFKLPKGAELKHGRLGGSSYPWDEWFSGEMLVIEQSAGELNESGAVVVVTEKRDYDVPKAYMPFRIKTAARKRYKVCEVWTRDHNGQKLENNGLIIKARDMTADERAAEDLRRAEEKDSGSDEPADETAAA